MKKPVHTKIVAISYDVDGTIWKTTREYNITWDYNDHMYVVDTHERFEHNGRSFVKDWTHTMSRNVSEFLTREEEWFRMTHKKSYISVKGGVCA